MFFVIVNSVKTIDQERKKTKVVLATKAEKRAQKLYKKISKQPVVLRLPFYACGICFVLETVVRRYLVRQFNVIRDPLFLPSRLYLKYFMKLYVYYE